MDTLLSLLLNLHLPSFQSPPPGSRSLSPSLSLSPLTSSWGDYLPSSLWLHLCLPHPPLQSSTSSYNISPISFSTSSSSSISSYNISTTTLLLLHLLLHLLPCQLLHPPAPLSTPLPSPPFPSYLEEPTITQILPIAGGACK